MISDEIGISIMNQCDFDDYVYGSPHNVSKECNEAISKANKIVGDYVNPYDVILDFCYPSIVEQELRLKKYVSKSVVSLLLCCIHSFYIICEDQLVRISLF